MTQSGRRVRSALFDLIGAKSLLAVPDLARDVRLLDRNRGSAAKRNEEDKGLKIHALKPGEKL
jgi:hypothetical protein